MMVAGALGRLVYALGLLIAPDAMSARGLAPSANGNSYGQMTTRAFGAVHTNVAMLTLRSAVLKRDMRLVLGLNIGCDLGDLAATVLESRNGDLPAGALIGSAVVQSVGMATWTIVLRSLAAEGNSADGRRLVSTFEAG
jgi:hypothetical protein